MWLSLVYDHGDGSRKGVHASFVRSRPTAQTAQAKALDGGGLFGRALAYTAGVETQGVGTLHFHALVNPGVFPTAVLEV